MQEQSPDTYPPGRHVVLALVVLLVLTATSYGISHVDLGGANAPVALTIAAVKAAVVATAFMEIMRASTPARIVVLVTIGFIALLCAGTIGDVAFREVG
jgi:cytochrome c oxidase subunit 4